MHRRKRRLLNVAPELLQHIHFLVVLRCVVPHQLQHTLIAVQQWCTTVHRCIRTNRSLPQSCLRFFIPAVLLCLCYLFMTIHLEPEPVQDLVSPPTLALVSVGRYLL